MTQQNFDLYNIKVVEVVEHLVKFHSVPFGDRASLSEDDFMFEHFPEILKDMQDDGYGFLTEEGKVRLRRVRYIFKVALRYCEENSVAICKVYDENEKGDGEWRVCKPTEEQLAFLKFKRWFACAEGYFNKAFLQEGMLADLTKEDTELLIGQLKDKIKEKREERDKKKEKKKEVIEVVA